MNTLARTALILLTTLPHLTRADDWPQWLGPKRDSVWRESGIVEKLPPGGPKLRWRTPIAGGYAGPAVANGRVYLTDRVLKTGADVPANPFARGQTPAVERILCLDEPTGKIVWQHQYDCPYTVSYPAGPRTTPAVDSGKVYTLGAEGNLFCLGADDGKVIWSRDLKKDYGIEVTPVWGFASNPLIDGRKLISFVGGEGTALVAFDKETGKELWRALSETGRHLSGYSSPIIIEAGGQRQLIAWHPEAVSALDPESGKVLWSQPMPLREGLALATPRLNGDRLFVSAFYDGSLLLQLDPAKPAATQVWRRKGSSEKNTDALHCLISTPFFDGPNIYGVDSYGQLRALDAATGDRLWESFAATGTTGSGLDRWAMAFLVKHDDRFFLFNEKGELIIARLTPKGYEEISRAKLLEPTNTVQRRQVVWSHPAFANRNVYARNDKEIVSYSLAAEESQK